VDSDEPPARSRGGRLHLYLRDTMPHLHASLWNPRIQCGFLNRLDQEVSGPVLIANGGLAWEMLRLTFDARLVKREYVALCHGKAPLGPLPLITAPLRSEQLRGPKGGTQNITSVSAQGDHAVTQAECTGHFCRLPGVSGDDAVAVMSLMRVKIWTGRTHQIRVHLRHIGHPIVCDNKYLEPDRCAKDQQWCPRIFLHAERLSYVDLTKLIDAERGGQGDAVLASAERMSEFCGDPHNTVDLSCPLSKDLQDVLDKLQRAVCE